MDSPTPATTGPIVWRRHLTGERALIGLAVAILAYEIAAPEGQLISHAFDRLLERHRTATTFAVVYTAAHILNILPPRVDLYHAMGTTIGH
ncbi:hypothetical protein [Nocardia ninae]|uniref:Uncharacterized protein n=1 Tax=Nocardia ninae NBRC 108245 TaxID=1210091 RepID=A0A511M9Y9_9NOCA|nr:hypothetical protein [Nocardia ninae]GEM37450.1 hypothetical protein NN4_19690 [Nocardia ninae NBRC 108245]